MQVFFGSPNDSHTLEEALALAPKATSLYVTRREHGWVFASMSGVEYVLDSGSRGYINFDGDSIAIYDMLGAAVAKLYVERTNEEVKMR